MSHIKFDSVTKRYKIKTNKKHLLYKNTEEITVINSLTFNIKVGEFVGYIGLNGAGKSTTIKILVGILFPDSGYVEVLERNPMKYRTEIAYEIGVVFGHRSQLLWDLPVRDTMELYKKLYRIPSNVYNNNKDMLIELLELDNLLNKCTRELSLGQRMRANIALVCLYDPKILFLDEPTIGLDVLAKETIRSFLRRINKEKKTTILLTTHDMKDVEETCDRVIFINEGKKIFDGNIKKFSMLANDNKYICITLNKNYDVNYIENLSIPGLTLQTFSKKRIVYKMSDSSLNLNSILPIILRCLEIVGVNFYKPSLEDSVKNILKSGDKNGYTVSNDLSPKLY